MMIIILFIFIILFIPCIISKHERKGLWTAYNPVRYQRRIHSSQNASDVCHVFQESMLPIKKRKNYHEILQMIETIQLWNDFETANPDDGSVLFGYYEAMQLIYKSQNPEDCSKAKYVVNSYSPGSGFASLIHTSGAGLSWAMKHNRVYLEEKFYGGYHSEWVVNNSFCTAQDGNQYLNFECYYLPWSKCTLQDAMHVAGVSFLNYSNLPYIQVGFQYDEEVMQKPILRINVSPIFTVPPVMQLLLSCSPIREHHQFYWWRAISASYLFRPNKMSLEWIRNNRIQYRSNKECISMYVRHGDKANEMLVVPFETFANATLDLFDSGYLNIDYKPNIFLGTEDAKVIDQALLWAHQHNFTLIYTNIFNKSSVSELAGLENVHDDREYLSMMLNLQLSLECKIWMCTTGSNSCRIIDELRATIMGKANYRYIDLGKHSCPTWENFLCW